MKDQSNKIVSVIVVSQGIAEGIFACLDSIQEQTYQLLDVMLIDNSLEPAFSQSIIRRYPFITIHVSPRNLYYCEALNLGITASQGDFILCLNDDVVLKPNFIAQALGGFLIDTRVGMVSGKILRSNRKTLDSAGLFLTPWRTAHERGYGQPDQRQYEKRGYIFGVNGAVALYRKKMLEEIKEANFFDNDFHIFFEDLDIAWRAQRAGWKGYYVPDAVAYHVRGATVRSQAGVNKPAARRFLSSQLHGDLIKNRYLAMVKNESALSFFLHLPFIILYDVIMWGYIILFCPGQVSMLALNTKYLRAAWNKRKRLE